MRSVFAALFLLVVDCVVLGCAPAEARRASVAAPSRDLADCPRTTDPNREVLEGLDSTRPDPCLPAYQECERACRGSLCRSALIGGGCAHLCSGDTEPYLVRAERFRRGEFDERCGKLQEETVGPKLE